MTPLAPDYREPQAAMPEPMTPEQFAQEMWRLAQTRGAEERHMEADNLICDLLKALGYGEGIKVFLDMVKWYA